MSADPSRFFFKLFLLGFSLILTGMILVIIANVSSSAFANFGGVIVIGPIPIIFGAGEKTWVSP